MAASAWAWRSCATSSSCTGERWPSRVGSGRRVEVHDCVAGPGRRHRPRGRRRHRAHESRPRRGSAPLEGASVLLVDDEPDAREVLAAILSGAGAAVTPASSAQDALHVMAGRAPDVLVSDIGMAVDDGYVFIRQVRALAGALGRVPSIAVTAYGHPADRARALAAGFDQFVVKPVQPRSSSRWSRARSRGRRRTRRNDGRVQQAVPATRTLVSR